MTVTLEIFNNEDEFKLIIGKSNKKKYIKETNITRDMNTILSFLSSFFFFFSSLAL